MNTTPQTKECMQDNSEPLSKCCNAEMYQSGACTNCGAQGMIFEQKNHPTISYLVSKKGVPYTLIKFDDIPDMEYPGKCITLSMCWFGKSKCYRFWDYNSQEKLIDFFMKPSEEMSLSEMLDIIQSKVDETKQ